MQKEMCYLNKPKKERKWKNYEGGPQLPGVSSCGGRSYKDLREPETHGASIGKGMTNPN